MLKFGVCLTLVLKPALALSPFLFMGCHSMDSYKGFRRNSGVFQVADGPVTRYNTSPSNGLHSSPTEPKSRYENIEPISMDLSRSQPVLDLTPDTSKLATQDLDFESAHDHSGVQDRLPQRDVRVNMSDRDVQYMLKELGFYSGSLDGKAGPQTKAAVRSFQKKHGLTVDGKAGPQTKRTLVKKLKEKLARNL